MIYIEVAVTAPIDHTLTYALVEEHAAALVKDSNKNSTFIGRRVLAPLGKRKVTGYILSVLPEAPDSGITVKKILDLPDSDPLFHANLIDLYRWAADYYHYPIGLVIKAALPAGLTVRSVKRIVINNEMVEVFKENAQGNPWLELLVMKNEISTTEFNRLCNTPARRKIFDNLIASKVLSVSDSLGKMGVKEKIEICFEALSTTPVPPGKEPVNDTSIACYRETLKRFLASPVKLAEAKALYILHKRSANSEEKRVPLRELKSDYPNISKALSTLVSNNLVLRSEQRIYRAPTGARLKKYARPERLTQEQLTAVGRINSAIEENSFHPFLLHGVTGSGKTEVYLQAAEKALESGKDVLIIVPEIALATQLESHLFSRFGELVALMHSGMSRSEKFDQFCRVQNGEARVVIGARSAVFAPLLCPGLIIVDEEHDGALKQDDSFRYNGRDLAVVRARIQKCVIVLGSATPSITSYANAKRGKYELLQMVQRVGSGSFPLVNVVDINTKDSNSKSKIIHKILKDSLESNLARKKQTILLLNRRGFSTVLLCQDCGTPVQCSHCHVSLTVHKNKGRLVCHYCGFNSSVDTICSQCRSASLVPAGFGTERVEEEVRELLPDARIARLDSDVSSDRKKFIEILNAMHNREIDILIGTQMIAKGHHFPDVTLVGVVWADGGMSMPDFRASERTFQLLTQVIGRAGRGDEPGQVIIQTMRPGHYAIEYAKRHDFYAMYEHELRLRTNPAFPPYVRLICLRLQGRVESDVQKYSFEIVRFCRREVNKKNLGIDILGPAPAPLDKIKDNFRWQILLKSKSPDHLRQLMNSIKEEKNLYPQQKCMLIIDVDPENMM